MDSSLHVFVRQLAGAVAAALVSVAIVAFWSIPYSLGGHPGEGSSIGTATPTHMT